jgi:hypothetical protein
VSRIENLVGVPLCLEYYAWPKNKDARIESLLIGDDLGICHLCNITQADWHYCEFKLGSKQANECHKHEIEEFFNQKIKDQHEHAKKPKMRSPLGAAGMSIMDGGAQTQGGAGKLEEKKKAAQKPAPA